MADSAVIAEEYPMLVKPCGLGPMPKLLLAMTTNVSLFDERYNLVVCQDWFLGLANRLELQFRSRPISPPLH